MDGDRPQDLTVPLEQGSSEEAVGEQAPTKNALRTRKRRGGSSGDAKAQEWDILICRLMGWKFLGIGYNHEGCLLPASVGYGKVPKIGNFAEDGKKVLENLPVPSILHLEFGNPPKGVAKGNAEGNIIVLTLGSLEKEGAPGDIRLDKRGILGLAKIIKIDPTSPPADIRKKRIQVEAEVIIALDNLLTLREIDASRFASDLNYSQTNLFEGKQACRRFHGAKGESTERHNTRVGAILGMIRDKYDAQ